MAKADYVKFVGKQKPPKDKMDKFYKPMPGPHAPDPGGYKPVIPSKKSNQGAYRIPGFGQVAIKKNTRRYEDKHAFNPGRKNTRYS